MSDKDSPAQVGESMDELLFSEELIRGCIADDDELANARKNGERFEIEGSDGKVTGYEWLGKIYITDIQIIPVCARYETRPEQCVNHRFPARVCPLR